MDLLAPIVISLLVGVGLGYAIVLIRRRSPILDPFIEPWQFVERCLDWLTGRPTERYLLGKEPDLDGQIGVVRRSFQSGPRGAEGTVFVRGEIWKATSTAEPIDLPEGRECRVVAMSDLHLEVEPLDGD